MKNKILKVILVIFMLAIIGGCVYLIIGMVNDRYKNNTTENNQTKEKLENKKEETPIEKINENSNFYECEELVDDPDEEIVPDGEITLLTDEKTIKEINNKLDYLYTGFCGSKNFKECFYKNNIDNSSIPESEKVYIALNSGLAYSYEKVNEKKYLDEAKTVMPDVEKAESYGITTFNALNKAYNTLFGGKITNKELVNHRDKYLSLSILAYSNKSDIYVSVYSGGGTIGGTYTYADKYMRDNNHVYVYMYVGYWSPGEKGAVLYTDYGRTNQYAVNGNQEEIFNQHYKEFSKYRITFRRNGNNYYFDKLEKVD